MNKFTLNEIALLIPGFAFKSSDFKDGTQRIIKIGDITYQIKENELSFVNTANYSANKLKKFYCHENDYVVAMTGNTIGKIGRVSVGSAYANQRVLIVRPNDKNLVDREYLWCILQQKNFHSHILNHIDSHSAQPNISASSIGSYEIELPEMEKQKKVASITAAIRRKIELNSRINDYLTA